MGWVVVALLVVLLGAGGMSFLRKAIGSSQSTQAAVDELLRDPHALVAEAVDSTPADFERRLRERIDARLRGPGSREEVFREVLSLVAERLSRRCLEGWVATAGAERPEHAFAVHEYMSDYDVAEGVTRSGAYEHLTPAQRSGLEAMPERDSLRGDVRAQVRSWVERDDGRARVRWVASVEEPVGADIYGLVRGA